MLYLDVPFQEKDEVKKLGAWWNSEKKNYNLSVGSYVEAKDTREVINIKVLNEEIKTIVSKIDIRRSEIDKIIAEMEVQE